MIRVLSLSVPVSPRLSLFVCLSVHLLVLCDIISHDLPEKGLTNIQGGKRGRKNKRLCKLEIKEEFVYFSMHHKIPFEKEEKESEREIVANCGTVRRSRYSCSFLFR